MQIPGGLGVFPRRYEGHPQTAGGLQSDQQMPGESEILSAYQLAVRPCEACGGCAGGRECVIRDGMERVWEGLVRADCVVVASPLHFSSLSAPLVAVISRWQRVWEARRAGGAGDGRRRFGVIVATGGAAYPGMFESARRVAAAGFVTLGVEYMGMLSVSATGFPDWSPN